MKQRVITASNKQGNRASANIADIQLTANNQITN